MVLVPLAVICSLASAAAPGCPPALAQLRAAADDLELGNEALGMVARLENDGAGGPTVAVAQRAQAISAAVDAHVTPLRPLAQAFREALSRHCELALAPRSPFASSSDRSALTRLLDRPDFRHVKSDPLALRRLLATAWSWLLDRLGSVEAERFASLGRAIYLAAVGAALFLALLAWRRRRHRTGSHPPVASAKAIGRAEEPDLTLALAEQALARGDLVLALRNALQACLAVLEKSGRVQGGRTLTNRELVFALCSKAESVRLAAELEGVVSRFDAVVYGLREPDSDGTREAVGCARRLRQELAGSLA